MLYNPWSPGLGEFYTYPTQLQQLALDGSIG